ncbi:hypothetical protein MF628_000797 [Paenibacillus polymyxa]|uniref:hypothetical protein n=1 Tax=Paenibacillus polymyxa TaxID=1406 RepID=UPI000FBBD510|nr:hypothetical protein [Paenibacillus polymyxa]URJ46279.1 hypothetical protein MF628_000797 [Paenibacillus polymyxa]
MKKKIMVGLLTVVACFTLGSTSFAASTTVPSPSTDPSGTSNVITPTDDIVVPIDLNVGEKRYLGGSNFWVSGDDSSIYLDQQGLVIGIKKGICTVVADLPSGDTIIYRINVK